MTDTEYREKVNELFDSLIRQDNTSDEHNYNALTGMVKNTVNCFMTAFDKGYSQGYTKGLAVATGDDEYINNILQKGMDMAWEAARRIVCPAPTGFTTEELDEMFAPTSAAKIIEDYTASEAIRNINSYYASQKCFRCAHDNITHAGVCQSCSNNDKFVPDWLDIPTDKMTEAQLRQAVDDMREMLAIKENVQCSST